jgi:uncharacterized damage-inducible protein DinB
MPMEAELTVAAQMFGCNNRYLAKCIDGLTAEEWNARPCETSNSMLWIVGHLVWARSMVLRSLGAPWTKPWLAEFARGKKLSDDAQYPSSQEMILAWNEASAALTAALEAAPAQTLSASAGERSPSFDGTIGGLVNFLAYHEAYHGGQAAYLRRWLGKDGIAG